MVWVGPSRRDLRALPKRVRSDIGQGLYTPQMGETDPAAKPLKGFGGASVMEIIEYTVQFADVIYVLHPFQKKSKRGIATPQKEIDLIRRRLAEAQRLHRQRSN
ncbi:MAG TPA: type II toxin-antitoxin system RelE/ParE family toxin [Nitrospirales bacterium]